MVNLVITSYRLYKKKETIRSNWRKLSICSILDNGLVQFLIDPFKKIDAFDLRIEVNVTSVLQAMFKNT